MKSIRLLMRKLQGEINMDSKRVIKRLALGLAVLATVTTSKSVEAFEVNQNVVSIEAQSITTQVPSDSYQDVEDINQVVYNEATKTFLLVTNDSLGQNHLVELCRSEYSEDYQAFLYDYFVGNKIVALHHNSNNLIYCYEVVDRHTSQQLDEFQLQELMDAIHTHKADYLLIFK